MYSLIALSARVHPYRTIVSCDDNNLPHPPVTNCAKYRSLARDTGISLFIYIASTATWQTCSRQALSMQYNSCTRTRVHVHGMQQRLTRPTLDSHRFSFVWFLAARGVHTSNISFIRQSAIPLTRHRLPVGLCEKIIPQLSQPVLAACSGIGVRRSI